MKWYRVEEDNIIIIIKIDKEKETPPFPLKYEEKEDEYYKYYIFKFNYLLYTYREIRLLIDIIEKSLIGYYRTLEDVEDWLKYNDYSKEEVEE